MEMIKNSFFLKEDLKKSLSITAVGT